MILAGINIQRDEKSPFESVDKCDLRPGEGIVQDCHSGTGEREISVVSAQVPSLMKEMEYRGLCMRRFFANLVIEGFAAAQPDTDDILSIGSAKIQISRAKKRCFAECSLVQEKADCPLKKGCAFAFVVQEGKITVGEEVSVTGKGKAKDD